MPHDLTPREIEVVRLLSLGCTASEAAKLLGVTSMTIDSQRYSAMNKLGVRNVALLTRMAIKHRICKLNDTLTNAEKRVLNRKRDGWN